MTGPSGNTEQRMQQYAAARGRIVLASLGSGYDGQVFSTNTNTAIKVFRYENLYRRERDVYLRLLEHDVFEVCGCRIPQLVDIDDTLAIIEMEIVEPPFVLDFAGAYLDQLPDFPEDVMQDWLDAKEEQFEDDWPLVQSIMATLSSYGVHLADVKPGNITLR